MERGNNERADWMKKAIKEMVDGIDGNRETGMRSLNMTYGFVRTCYLESRKEKI